MPDDHVYHPQIKITWLIGTLAAFAIFVLIGAYSARMTQTYTDYDQDRAAQRYATLAEVRHDEQALLYPVDAQGHSTAVWVDQDKGIIRIPIDEAMAETVNALKAKPVQMGAAIPGAVPPPAPAPAPAATAPAKPGTPAAKPATAAPKPKA